MVGLTGDFLNFHTMPSVRSLGVRPLWPSGSAGDHWGNLSPKKNEMDKRVGGARQKKRRSVLKEITQKCASVFCFVLFHSHKHERVETKKRVCICGAETFPYFPSKARERCHDKFEKLPPP